MNGRTFLQALMDAQGLNSNSLGERSGNRSLQSTAHRYLSNATKESRRTTLQPIADFFQVDVGAFFDADKARSELARLNISSQQPPIIINVPAATPATAPASQ